LDCAPPDCILPSAILMPPPTPFLGATKTLAILVSACAAAGLGVVEELGPSTSGTFRPGQRVVGMPFAAGTWQQYVLANEENLVSGGLRDCFRLDCIL
jgi:hypothetical protein